MNTNTDNRRFYNLIALLVLVCALFGGEAMAQNWGDGDLITIRSGTNNYLSSGTDGTTIRNVTTLDETCLWLVAGNNDIGYTLQSPISGRYLTAAGTSNNSALTLPASGTATRFRYVSTSSFGTTRTRLDLMTNTGRGIAYSSSAWRIGNLTSLSNYYFESFTLSPRTLKITPEIHKYATSTTQLFTIAWQEGYIGDAGSTIDMTTAVVAADSPSFTLGGDTRFAMEGTTSSTATVRANTGATSGRLTASVTYQGRTYIATAQLYYDIAFMHQTGMSGRSLISNGSGKYIQGTHVVSRILYMNPGTIKRLELPLKEDADQRMATYYRWYNYDTDMRHNETTANQGAEGRLYHTTTRTGTNENNLGYTSNVYGHFKYSNATARVLPYYTKFRTPSSAFEPIRIACDASNQTDYSTTNGIIVEPTLSYRLLYEIRDAKEMADLLSTCTGEKFLEEYTLEAPAGTNNAIRFGPKYRYGLDAQYGADGGCDNFHNYYYYKNGTPTQVNWNSTYTWKCRSVTKNADGSVTYGTLTTIANPTIRDGRLLEINDVNTPGTWEYQLTCTDGTVYNIAKITVEYKAKSVIGPVLESGGKAIITESELEENYILLAAQRFDYNDGVPYNFTNASIYYDKPLPWNDISYGFRYLSNRHSSMNAQMPDWSEYTLIRSAAQLSNPPVTWMHRTLSNRSGAANGYFLYVDAGVPAEKIADLSVEGHLCSGTTLYFSAWIANMATSGDLPNLLFTLTGYDAAGNDTELQKWTTGNVGSTSAAGSVWSQVFYEIALDDDYTYDHYTIRVYNNGKTSTGNDFAFDDFQIYMNKAPTSSMQLLSNCMASEGELTIIFEVDYLQWFNENLTDSYKGMLLNADGTINESSSWPGQNLYYRWEDSNENPIQMEGYLGNIGLSADYGYINLPLVPTEKIVRSFSVFFNQDAANVSEADYFFLWEDGAPRPLLYIVQRSRDFLVNQAYYTGISISRNDLNDAKCSSKSLIIMRNTANIVIDGQTEITQLCTGWEYTAVIKFYTNDNEGHTIEGSGFVDWYEIDSQTTPEKVARLESWLKAFRADYHSPDDLSFDRPVTAGYTQAIKDSLLAQPAYKFTLFHNSIQFELNEVKDKVSFYAFPIIDTIEAKEGNYTGLAFCSNPVYVEFVPDALGGVGSDDLPEEIAGLPTNVRLSETEANDEFDLPVSFSEYGGNIYIDNNSFTLIGSTDPAYHAATTSFHYVIDAVTSGGNTTVDGPFLLDTGDIITLKPDANNTIELKEGYKYEFKAQLGLQDNAGDDCAVRVMYFNVLVVPGKLYWSPLETSKAWNKDENWYLYDETAGAYRQGFVPKSFSDVVLPEKHVVKGTANPSWPELPINTTDQYTTEASATPYISYDLYYEKRHCNQIYFEPMAVLLNQQSLVYNKAWVDVRLPKQEYVWKAAPMLEVYGGDLYIPTVDDQNKLFTEEGYLAPLSRWNYSFWTFLFNTVSVQQQFGGTVQNPSLTWTFPTNYLAQQLNPGTGFQLWIGCEKDDQPVTLRLPKPHSEYYYHDEYDQKGTEKVTNSKTTAAYKLGFTPNDGKMTVTIAGYGTSEYFLVGNPFMAYLNLEKFMEENDGLLETVYVADKTMTGSDSSTPGEEIYKLRNIAPTESFLVRLKQAASSLTVTFTPGMASYLSQVDTPAIRASRNPLASEKEKLYIEAEMANMPTSSALLAVDSNACDDYVLDEDADLMQGNPKEFGVFTQQGDKALIINKRQLMDRETFIPLGFLLPTDNSLVTLTFTGSESFPDKLYLFDSKAKTYTALHDNEALTLEAQADQFRYFITQYDGYTSLEEVDHSLSPEVYVYNQQTLTASVVSKYTIESIVVYDAMGRPVVQVPTVDNCHYDLVLPQSGTYVIRVYGDNFVESIKMIIR